MVAAGLRQIGLRILRLKDVLQIITPHHHIDQFCQDGAFVPKNSEDRLRGNPCLLGDGLNCRTGVAIFHEQPVGGFQKLYPVEEE